MAISPPPTGGSGSGASKIPDAILSIIFPLCLIVIALFFLCFFVGVVPIKQFGAFGLCGLSAFTLYQSAIKNGANIVNWRFSFPEWTILVLLTHTIYFSVVIDWITK